MNLRLQIDDLRHENRLLRELIESIVISAPFHVVYITAKAKALAGSGAGTLMLKDHGPFEQSLSWEKKEDGGAR